MAVSFCAKKFLLPRSCLHMSKRRGAVGYIVLLPELGEDVTEKNPLLKEDQFPNFADITQDKCRSAIIRQSLEFENCMTNIAKTLEKNESLDIVKGVLNPMEESCVPLEISWGIAMTLCYGHNSFLLKNVNELNKRVMEALCTRFAKQEFYKAYKKALENECLNLTQQQRVLLSKYALEGRLNGLELTDESDRHDYTFACKKIKQHTEDYEDKLMIARRTERIIVKDMDAASAFPKRLLKHTAEDPMHPENGPWRINFEPHIYNMFMTYCPNRILRWRTWLNYTTVGSTYKSNHLQISSALENLRYRRCEQAKLLGYHSYAHLSMETKMAGNLENIHNTISILRKAAYPHQQRDFEMLSKYANDRGLHGALRVWDMDFWIRKHYIDTYKLDPENICNYFPLPKVLNGLFDFMETMFGVKIVGSKSADGWDPNVRLFDVFDLKKQSTEPIGNFYLDPCTRGYAKIPLNLGGGVMVPIKKRSKLCGNKPLLALIFNFAQPAEGKPSLLTFSDVKCLFQEFGQALHYLLSEGDCSETSGITFIENDFVFVPKYFMENWIYDTSMLQQISGHYNSDEPLPAEFVEAVKNSRTHFAGHKLCQELYLSHLDLSLYSSSDDFWKDIMNVIWKQYFVFGNEKKNSHVCSFEDIFVGSYAAGYYGHFWSRMIAADIFGAFEEVKAEDKEQQKQIANRYRDTILALPPIYPANEVFRRFRGRDYNPSVFLKHLGLTENIVEQTNQIPGEKIEISK